MLKYSVCCALSLIFALILLQDYAKTGLILLQNNGKFALILLHSSQTLHYGL